MKIIHCSDLHLDSPFSSRRSPESAREQRARLLHTFVEMTDWAAENGVRAILLCGDIFDSEGVPEPTLRTVEQAIRRKTGILFFYLCGNHDPNCPLFETGDTPPNFRLFKKKWTSFVLSDRSGAGRVRLTGLSYSGRPLAPRLTELALPPSETNIVLLHGTPYAGSGAGQDPSVTIPLSLLRGKGIDYLALGHVHTPGEGSVDARGIYVNPGCLSGRGYDECGPRGFVLIETGRGDAAGGRLSHRFVPFARSVIHDLQADCTGCESSLEIADRMRAAMAEDHCTVRDIVRVTLTGSLGPDVTPDPELLQREGGLMCSDFSLRDETVCGLSGSAYLSDISLRGEFVRAVSADQELSDEMKTQIIRRGLAALSGDSGRL